MNPSGKWGKRGGWVRLLAPLVIILLVAAFFRLYRLDTLPPGLYYDEAFNGTDVRSILSGESFPLFLAGNYGRESLYMFLQAVVVAVVGYSSYALRLTSALIGIATVGVVYWGAWNFWLYEPRKSQGGTPPAQNRLIWVAAVATAGLAVLYWHVSVSRLGLRAVTLPLFSLLAMVFFWRAWCTGRRRDFILAGLWFGLAQYTYSVARFLPFVIAIFLLIEGVAWVIRRRRGEQSGMLHLRGLLWMTGVGTLVIIPLVVILLAQPELVTMRLAGVGVFTAAADGVLADDPWARLFSTTSNTLLSFYVTGDPIARHNLPNRPVHDPLLALLFTLGLGGALWQIRQARPRLLLIWLAVMMTPVILSVPAPHFLRGVGMLPPLVLLYGVAADLLWRMMSTPRRRLVGGTAVMVVLTFSAVSTARDYFTVWPLQPDLDEAFDQDTHLAAEYIRLHQDEIKAGKPIVLTRRLFLAPEIRFVPGPLPWRTEITTTITLPGATRVLPEREADPYQAAFLLTAPDGELAVTMLEELPPGAGAPTEVLESPFQLPNWTYVDVHQTENLTVTPHSIQYPLAAQFANGIRFLGYEMRPLGENAPLAPGDYELITYWQKQSDAGLLNEGTTLLFTHFVYPTGQTQRNGPLGRAPATGPILPISLWRPGEVIDDRRLIYVPPDAQGKAYFEIGLYTPLADGGLDRISILDDQGNAVADQIQFGVVPLRMETPQEDLSQLEPLDVDFEERVRLRGWQIQADPVQPDTLTVNVGWQTLDRMPSDYTAFVHLVDGEGSIMAQADLPPGGSENPTTRWLPAETVLMKAQLVLPPGMREQAQALRIGLYEPVGGRQLAVTAATTPGVTPGDTYVLAPLAGPGQP